MEQKGRAGRRRCPGCLRFDAAGDLAVESKSAPERLVQEVPAAKEARDAAVAVLVFPDVVKAGLIVGGQYGEGTLFENGAVKRFYSSAAASIGLQAGGQNFDYAMFFMNEAALNYLNASDGWDVGSAPTLVYGDQGWSSSMSVSELQEDILVMYFGQEGIMAGGGIQGAKITQIDP